MLINAIIALGYTVITTDAQTSSAVTYKRVLSAPGLYQIVLPPYTPTSAMPTTTSVMAPVSQSPVTVTSPTAFRLHFTQPDTLGHILGFRDPGSESSITPYRTLVRNIDLYDWETKLGMDPAIALATSFDFVGHRYIYMCCDILKNMETTSVPAISSSATSSRGSAPAGNYGKSLANIFAKIQLDACYGDTLFKSYVHAPKRFITPLASLSSLEISFVTPSGELYDFNGQNHSFTITITQTLGQPCDIQLNTNTGQTLQDLPSQLDL
jgi:hypothetical protein